MSESKQKFRSPPYPSLSLEKALERAAQLKEVSKSYAVPLTAAAKAWGFSEKSSATTTVAAALNQYGLINDDGAREHRRIAVSELAEKILMDPRPDSAEKLGAMREAALSPSIFREIWDKYQATDIDTHTLIYELTLGRKQAAQAPFSELAATEIARLYREAMSYAKVDRPESNPDLSQKGVVDRDERGYASGQSATSLHGNETEHLEQAAEQPRNELISAAPNQFEEKKALDEGDAYLVWPRDLSHDSVEDMEYWLNGVLRQIKRRAAKTKG